MSPEQLLKIYAQQIDNLDSADDTGLDEELVLLTRNSVADFVWTPEQQQLIARLDDQLAAHWRAFEAILPNQNFQDRQRWWWFLHEGPQVRLQALQAA
jgi:hypothetical protein